MNRFQRLWHSAILMILPGDKQVADYIRKHHLYGSIGKNCHIQKRKLPLYSNLVFLHDNVRIASHVGFITHDIIHRMLNAKFHEKGFIERIGCIEVMDNVFIGSGTRILYNTRIGSNVIIGSDSLVSKDIPDNSVYAGVPARFICTFDEYVEKARKYSASFKEQFGMEQVKGVSDDLAQEMYKAFLKEKDAKDETV